MNKFYKNALSVILLVATFFMLSAIVVPFVFAEDTADSANTANTDATVVESKKTTPIFQVLKDKIKNLQDRVAEKKPNIQQVEDAQQNANLNENKIRNEIKEKNAGAAEKKVEAVKQKVEEKRAEIKEKLNDAAKGRISAYAERVIKRFNAAITRYEEMMQRIETRIIKIEKEKGISLNESKNILEKARGNILVAKDKVAEAAAEIGKIIGDSETPKGLFEKAKQILGEAKTAIFDAHKILVELIKSVKSSAPDKGAAGTEQQPGNVENAGQ